MATHVEVTPAEHDLRVEDVTASRIAISGRITDCRRPAAGYEVIAHEVTEIGFRIPRKPCRVTRNTRTVGSTVTGEDGSFDLSFAPTPDRDEYCAFTSSCHIEVFDGDTRRWKSPPRATSGSVRFDHELDPDCVPESTPIHVVGQRGDAIADAEVFVDGELRGRTDAAGRLFVEPPLEAGAELVARHLVHEQPTPRGSHTTDSHRDWSYRVWTTSLDLVYDRDTGDDPGFNVHRVDDPSEPQTVRLALANTLVALNLHASIEWHATGEELARYRDRLMDMSELLFNATDGQFLVSHLTVSDAALHWDDADIRIHANLNTASHADLAAIFGDDGHVHMNPNDAHYSGTLLHELGHYAFGVHDEYEHGPDSDEDQSPYCTLRTAEDSGPFADGGVKDSCLMRGNRFGNRSKFCSGHSLNPHNPNNEQGEQPCWSEIVSRFNEPPTRLRTPEDRGAILPLLPDTGIPLPTETTPPARMTPAPSVIPLPDWKPSWHLRTLRGEPCEDTVIARVRLDGEPVNGAVVSLEHEGTKIEQGRTKPYDLVHGVQSDPGEVPLRGAHVGDELQAMLLDLDEDVAASGRTTVDSCTGIAVIDLERHPLPIPLRVEPGEPRHLRVEVSGDPEARALPRVRAHVDRVPYTLRVSTRRETARSTEEPAAVGELAGLPLTGRAAVEATTNDARDELSRRTRVSFTGTFVDERLILLSADGRVKLHVGEGTLAPPIHLLIAPAQVPAPEAEVLSGPYRLSQWPEQRLRRPTTLRFELPTSEESALPDRPEELTILRRAGGQWQPVPSQVAEGRPAVTTRIRQLGTYALAVG